MVSRRDWHERVNEVWPDPQPTMSAIEGERAARKLYRFVRGRKWTGPVKITSGNRHSWIEGGVLLVNPEGHPRGRGPWNDLVHDLSHCLWNGKPHDKGHARLELRMAKEAVRRGWLSGALRDTPKPAAVPTPSEVRLAKLKRVEARLKRWESRAKRARTAIVSLSRSRRALERALRAGAVPATTAPSP